MNIIFDVDGTLADSLHVAIGIFQAMSPKHQRLTDQDINDLRSMPARTVMRELGISFWRAPWLLARGRAKLKRNIHKIELFDDMDVVIKRLYKAEHTLYIMSSNSSDNVHMFLKNHRIDSYFTRIYGSVGIFGKTGRLRKILRDNRLDPAETYYIGDESRDIEAAQAVGIHAVAVTWGYNSPSLLEKHQPDFLINSPNELIKVFGKKVS